MVGECRLLERSRTSEACSDTRRSEFQGSVVVDCLPGDGCRQRLEFLDEESFLAKGCQEEGYVYYVPGDCPEARKLRDIIVIQVAGLVIFTLVVNGSFAGTVYRCLHVYARYAFRSGIRSPHSQ